VTLIAPDLNNMPLTRVGIENGKILTETPTDPPDAVNIDYLQSNYYSKIATSASIDAKISGQTTLYTVPAGKKFFLKHIDIETVAIDTPSTSFSFTVGANNPGYDNWMASGMFGSTTQGIFKTFSAGLPMAGSVIFVAGDMVKLNVVSGATATTFTIKVKVWGYLETA